MSQESLNLIGSDNHAPSRNNYDEASALKCQAAINEFNRQEALQTLNEEEEERTKAEAVNRMMNNLKIPDAIKDLPQYRGDKNGLYEFIQNVEEILAICQPACSRNPNYTLIITRAIRNKIIGDAHDVLLMYGTETDWTQIRTNLITHYADKRDETSLIRDLHRLYQGTDTVEKFFARIIDISNTLSNSANINTPINENRVPLLVAKRSLYNSMCLSVFLAGLRDPMGSMIRAMRPTTLPEALNYCLKEQNIGYIKNRPQEIHRPSLPPRLPQRPIQSYQLNSKPQFFGHPQRNYSPQQDQYFNHRPNGPTRQNPHLPPGNNAVVPFRPLHPKLEPMDKYNQQTYAQRPQFQPRPFQQKNYFPLGPPKMQSQELFHIDDYPQDAFYDTDHYYGYPVSQYIPIEQTNNEDFELKPNQPVQEIIQNNYIPSLDNEIADEDFRQSASIHLSDTSI